MKRIYPAFLLWLTSMGTMAQGAPAFTFENESALSQWTATGGELSISGEHYKDGEKSLCWEASNGDVMTHYRRPVLHSFTYIIVKSVKMFWSLIL